MTTIVGIDHIVAEMKWPPKKQIRKPIPTTQPPHLSVRILSILIPSNVIFNVLVMMY